VAQKSHYYELKSYQYYGRITNRTDVRFTIKIEAQKTLGGLTELLKINYKPSDKVGLIVT
jgi:hypothetical protein